MNYDLEKEKMEFVRLLERYKRASANLNFNTVDEYVDAKTEIVNKYMKLVGEKNYE